MDDDRDGPRRSFGLRKECAGAFGGNLVEIAGGVRELISERAEEVLGEEGGKVRAGGGGCEVGERKGEEEKTMEFAFVR